ncbi:Nuclear rim protein 1 [Candida viswanathii]|uniref:Nuclear rim protein 1 n=1 Tax=Candida viswanathii TaxID=5486 RepID=A0A367Y9D9_9ASCO|nr:Nuclear rim protein 1 [Candida viswanathii]
MRLALECVGPSKFALYLFVGLNPVNLYLVYYLMSDFLNLVNDKQILYQEMFQEYNKKFVQPKTNILKKDRMVDATMGPFYLSSLNDNRPYAFSKLKVFVTHDMKGNAITEYGELDSRSCRSS